MEENKTFTQEEVNAIIGERLKQERAKIMKEVQEKEAELTRRESFMNTRAEWQKKGLPVELLECLDQTKIEAASTILEGMKGNNNSSGGWSGGKNPVEAPKAGEALRDANGNPTDYAIRQRMGLIRKDE